MDNFKKSDTILDGGSSEWDESEHPRDDGNGQFVIKGETGILKKSSDLTDASNSEALTIEQKQNKIKGQKAKLLSLKNKPDGTYDLETGEAVSYESGYQVSFQQTGDTYTDSEYDDKVAEMIKVTKSIAHAGVFGGVPEISFHTNDIGEALKIATEYNQHSIWDWRRGRIIKNRHYNPENNKVNKE